MSLSARSLTFTLSACALLIFQAPAFADKQHAVIFKGGSLRPNDSDQEAARRDVDLNNGRLLAIAHEIRGKHYTGGFEFMEYRTTWDAIDPVSTRTDGKIIAWMPSYISKKYFGPFGGVAPFIGGGIGLAYVKQEYTKTDPLDPGTERNDTLELTAQFSVGAEFRFDAVGLYTEVKALYLDPSETDSEAGSLNRYPNLSGVSAMVGISMLF